MKRTGKTVILYESNHSGSGVVTFFHENMGNMNIVREKNPGRV